MEVMVSPVERALLYVGPKTDLDMLEKKISSAFRNRTPILRYSRL
jgi:uncharacterized protein YbaR (Trm112 family)